MEHLQIRNQLGQNISAVIAREGNLPVTLRPYQKETLEETAKWLLKPKGTNRAYVSHATGLGKTILFASIVIAASSLRTLIIVPTKALLEQTARVVTKFSGGMLGHLSSLTNIQDRDGKVIAVRGMEHSSVVLTTDASFRKHADRIKEEFDPHLILRDECHWSYVESAQTGLNRFAEAVIIGFSATPDFLTNAAKGGYLPVTLENGSKLYGPQNRFADTHFQTKLDHRSIRWGIENGWLAPLAWGQINFDVELMDHVPVVENQHGTDYDSLRLQKLMHEHWPVMCETMVRLYDNAEYDLPNRQAYAVCPSVKAAEELAEAINSFGIPAACVTGKTPDTERNILLRAFDEKQIRLLTSVMVLREGWDAPNAEVCLMLRPTKSRTMYEQIMGRVLRLPKDGEHKVALVLDAYFLRSRLHPLSAPMLFAKPGEEIPSGGIIINKSGKSKKEESPYLPVGAQPKLVVVPECDSGEILLVGENATLEAEGKIWKTVKALSKYFALHVNTVRNRCLRFQVSARQGKSGGQVAIFYSLTEANKACADLLNDLPRAREDGTFEVDGEVWAMVPAFAELFTLHEDAVRHRCQKSKVSSRKGKLHTNSQRGRNSRNDRMATFYSLTEAKKACADLIDDLPRAREDGTLETDGEVWAIASTLANLFSLSTETVRYRCKKLQVSSRQGKSGGQVTTFYSLTEAKKACAYLLNDLPRVRKDGTLETDGEVWAIASTLANLFSLSTETVRNRCKKLQVSSRKKKACAISREGKVRDARVSTYYSLIEAKKACADLIDDLPRAREDGTLETDGEVWAMIPYLVKLFVLSAPTIRKRCQKFQVSLRKGKFHDSRVSTFYSLTEAKKACADLLELKAKLDMDKKAA